MTHLLIDTSVLLKWFHTTGESEVAAARALLDGHRRGDLTVHMLDLALYELGNVLVRALHWPAGDVADQLDDLIAICGAPLAAEPGWLRDAAALATDHRLTFYDAAWAAAARAVGVGLVSADRALVSARLAETPTAAAGRLGLPEDA